MIEASVVPYRGVRPLDRRRGRNHVDHLKDLLSIAEPQMEAWMSFAETHFANRRRMESDEGGDQPFGALEDRLAAFRSMRAAAAQLFPLLDPAQRNMAMRHLPLCCLPHAPVD